MLDSILLSCFWSEEARVEQNVSQQDAAEGGCGHCAQPPTNSGGWSRAIELRSSVTPTLNGGSHLLAGKSMSQIFEIKNNWFDTDPTHSQPKFAGINDGNRVVMSNEEELIRSYPLIHQQLDW